MPCFHVLISLASAPDRLRVALSDLTEDELTNRFVKPYGRGKDLLCGNEAIPIAEVRKRHIVRTAGTEAMEREAYNVKDRARIDELNRSSRVVFITTGAGFDPEDLLEIGDDVTGQYLKGTAGYAARP